MQLSHIIIRLASPIMAIMPIIASCSSSTEPTSSAAAPPPAKQATVFDFEKDGSNTPPAGFTEALTGGGGPAVWRVQEVDDAPSGKKIVAQLSDDRTNARYPHLVRDDFKARDIDLSVRFKTISGQVDASGGLVFRYLDKNNFYVVRANALEDNVVAYKTENGRRSNIGVKGKGNAYGVKADVPHRQWNTLRIIMKGSFMGIFMNGRKLFEVENDTFSEAGKVGLWTKADAITQFDDLRITSLDDAGQSGAGDNPSNSQEGPIKEYGPNAGAMHMQGHYAKLGLLDVKRLEDFDQFEVIRDIVRHPADLPPPLKRNHPETVEITLEAREVISEIDDGIFYNYWTYDGKVPGPILRVREGDTVMLTLKSNVRNSHGHSIDLHAATGPAGGGTLTQVAPGESKSLTFKALAPGFYVYHCSASPKETVAVHVANQMFGGIIVEPKDGLTLVDKEFVVFQGELYTPGSMGEKGFQRFDPVKLLNENPTYFTFNGKPAGLTDKHALRAKVGQTVRIFFANMGNSRVSSFHIIGENLDKVYLGASRRPSAADMETVMVGAGQGIIADVSLQVPGRYIMVDHSLARVPRGAWGVLEVEGEPNEAIFSEHRTK